MPTFPAPGPITAVLEHLAGSVTVVASDRDDVVVSVRPVDEDRDADVRAAQDVVTRFADGLLTVTGPRGLSHALLNRRGAVAVTVELPTGSALTSRLTAGTLHTEGALGAVDASVSAGDARVDSADRLDLRVSAGSASVGRVTGPADLRVGAGDLRITELDGEAIVKASVGRITVGSVTGSLTVNGTSGQVVVDRLRGTLNARASHGSVRVERAEAGAADLTTSFGSVEIGVPEGTAALLDVASTRGSVRNTLQPVDGPGGDEDTLQVRARTSFGDVVVRRPSVREAAR